MDDLSVLQQGNQVLESRLMSECTHGYHDDTGALNSLCHIAGIHIKISLAAAIEAVTVRLRSDQFDTGLVQVLQCGRCKRHCVEKPYFLCVAYTQLTVCCDRLAYGASADNSNGFLFKVFHTHDFCLR